MSPESVTGRYGSLLKLFGCNGLRACKMDAEERPNISQVLPVHETETAICKVDNIQTFFYPDGSQS
jgi:hypothetical protein